METKFQNINVLEVKVNEFKADYVNIIAEKENALTIKMMELDSRVQQEIETIRQSIIEKVKILINEEVDSEFDNKIKLYEKYLYEPEIVVENIIVEPVIDVSLI